MRAKNNYVRLIPSRAIRGAIFDRNGQPLAYDRATFSLSLIPYQSSKIKDIIIKDLSSVLGYEQSLLHKNYKKNFQNYFSPVNLIDEIDKTTALEVKEKFSDDVLINPQPQRYYPYPYQFSHVIGYVKNASIFYEKLKKYGYHPLERVGFSGVEQHYNSYLKGEDGGDLIEVNSKGKTVGFLGELLPKKGKDIYLTIDKEIQLLAVKILGKRRGAILLMDSSNGEIIALCSSPSFDLNDFISGNNIETLLQDKRSPLLNRATQSTYPIGSVFKPILGMAGLSEEKITESTIVNCEGSFKLGNTSFRCGQIHKNQNIYQALSHSCNTYFYNLGLALGPNLISKWAQKFNLNKQTGIDIPYEKSGFIPTVKWKQKIKKQNWFSGDTINLSIGQGYLSVSPIETLVAINAFANGGYIVTPRLIKQIDNTPVNNATSTDLLMEKTNVDIVTRGLRKVVTDANGTAHMLDKLNFAVSGKTGTAQNNKAPHGWFIGFFPHKAKKYTLCVFLENCSSSHKAVEATYILLKTINAKNLL